jgi:hypothetical protein
VPTIEVKSFTVSANGTLAEIVIEAGLSLPLLPTDPIPEAPSVVVRSLWDTGSTSCAITEETASKLGLVPIGKAEVHHAGGSTIQNVYSMSLFLPNEFIIPYIRATECKSTQGNFDFIVGMDIITLGDFSITNVQQRTTVSFRMPSVETIDYVKQTPRDSRTENRKIKESIGRNDPCPCGSGKKYKHCHGRQ